MAEQTTALTVPQRAALIFRSEETEKRLIELASQSAEITRITNLAGFQQCHAARMVLKRERLDLEKTDETARADLVILNKGIIGEKKRLLALITPEEDRLGAIQQEFTEAREREKQAEALAEQKRIEAERQAKREAEDRVLAAQRAEIERQREELAALERERMEAERQRQARFDAEAREARERQEAAERESRRKIEEEERQARLAREQADREARQAREDEEARIRAERKAEEDRIAAERAKIEAERRAAEDAQRKLREAEEAKERAERARVEAEERVKREDEEAQQRAIMREQAELADGMDMLQLFVQRFGKRAEFSFVVTAINKYLKKS